MVPNFVQPDKRCKRKNLRSMSQSSIQKEDVKPSSSTSNSQSEDCTAVKARLKDLWKTGLSLDESISQQAMSLLKESKHLLVSNIDVIGSGSLEEIKRSWFAFVLYSVKKSSECGNPSPFGAEQGEWIYSVRYCGLPS